MHIFLLPPQLLYYNNFLRAALTILPAAYILLRPRQLTSFAQNAINSLKLYSATLATVTVTTPCLRFP